MQINSIQHVLHVSQLSISYKPYFVFYSKRHKDLSRSARSNPISFLVTTPNNFINLLELYFHANKMKYPNLDHGTNNPNNLLYSIK